MVKGKPKQKTQVARTNDCSIYSKASIVTKCYVEDVFLKYFVPKSSIRSPIINRGYYVRHRAIQYGFNKIFFQNEACNVVISLGCGFDTSSLRYPNKFFIEIDYPSVCDRKVAILKENGLVQSNEILYHTEESNKFGLIFYTNHYILIGADLRQSSQLKAILEQEQILIFDLIAKYNNCFNESINFVLFNECSLCYIEQELTDELLNMLLNVVIEPFCDANQCTSKTSYLGYEMLRSKTSQNNFGDFLLQHFKSLEAPILTFIDEDQIHDRFINKLNFNSLEIINMKHFWRKVLNSDQEERERINLIEPFDEWEELDNVCASYSLTIATKKINKNFNEENVISKIENKTLTNNKTLLNAGYIYTGLSIFGHCSDFYSDGNVIKIFGGFGHDPSESFDLNNVDLNKCFRTPHKRLSNIVQIILTPSSSYIEKVNIIKPINSNSINRIHSKVVPLNSNGNIYFLSGGRTSPAKVMDNVIVEINDQNQYELRFNEDFNRVSSDFSIIPKAYRHICTLFGINSKRLIQFGGIIPENSKNPSETIFTFDTENCIWSTNKIPNLKTERHSMACTTFGANTVLVNGGLELNGDFCGFSDIELIDSRELKLNKFNIKNFNSKLYSHCMKTISDSDILIIGGIGYGGIYNTAYRIDLRSNCVVEEYQLACNDQFLMLHNFTCEVISSSQQLCLLGGGGNCFSFGTFFNPVTLFNL